VGSQSWKLHEKNVAKFFGGQRLKRYDYGLSQPDVIIRNDYDNYPKETKEDYPYQLAAATVGVDCDVVIECKYSQDQTWHKKIHNIIKESPYVTIVRCNQYIFWSMKDTSTMMEYLRAPAIDFILANRLIEIDKKIPKYISNAFNQVLEYKSFVKTATWLPIVCLGQKSSKDKILVTFYSYLEEALIAPDIECRAKDEAKRPL
jgi:hypothetical protein